MRQYPGNARFKLDAPQLEIPASQLWCVCPFYNRFYDHPQTDQDAPRLGGERYSPYMDGYKPGAPLTRSILGMLHVQAPSLEAACEAVFMRLNEDERENGRDEPSLSMGDVLLVVGPSRDPDACLSIMAVGTRGFERVTPEQFLRSVERGAGIPTPHSALHGREPQAAAARD